MKAILKLVWSGFKEFADRLVFLVLLYGRFAFLFIAASILIPDALHRYLGVSHAISITIMRILLTITPIFPTMIYIKSKEEDYTDEHYSIDLCFIAWIITIVFAWWIV